MNMLQEDLVLPEVAPPMYDNSEDFSSPMYSVSAGSSERVIQFEPFRRTGCPDCDWIYETEHMSINMGSRVWGLHAPSYGLGGRIEGTLTLAGKPDHVERVTATLEGHLSSVTAHRSSGCGDGKTLILSRTIPLYASCMNDDVPWGEEQLFSIPIPTEVHVQGILSRLPPSFGAYYHNLSCEITYSLKFHMTRKGMRRHESKTIPILYLPKSRPSEPPLAVIPRPSRELSDVPTSMYERVKTINLVPYWPNDLKSKQKSRMSLDGCSRGVFFSLPDPQCFSSGEPIPFTLSLVFPHDPVLANLLTRNIRIVLQKRIRLWRRGDAKRDSETVVRDSTLASAQMRYLSEYAEGVSLLRGTIRAGSQGRESSWCVEGVAETQYILRVILHPPPHAKGYLPSFRHEEVLEITTDSWGTLERELTATGGTPTPALGLASNLITKKG